MMGLLCGLSVVLGTVLSIKVIPLTGVYKLNLSLNLLPVQLAGYCCGPAGGFLVGFLADLLKWLVNPMGAYHPGFGFSMGMIGFVPSIIAHLFRRRRVRMAHDLDPEWLNGLTWFVVFPGIAVAQVLFSLFLNSFWIATIFGENMYALMPIRIVNAIIMIPLYSTLVRQCGRLISRLESNRSANIEPTQEHTEPKPEDSDKHPVRPAV